MTDEKETVVVFRRYRGADRVEIIALFPELPGTNEPHTCASYQHVGQHGSADPTGVVRATKPAHPGEYGSLLMELRDLGYNLDIKQKITFKHYEARKRALT